MKDLFKSTLIVLLMNLLIFGGIYVYKDKEFKKEMAKEHKARIELMEVAKQERYLREAEIKKEIGSEDLVIFNKGVKYKTSKEVIEFKKGDIRKVLLEDDKSIFVQIEEKGTRVIEISKSSEGRLYSYNN